MHDGRSVVVDDVRGHHVAVASVPIPVGSPRRVPEVARAPVRAPVAREPRAHRPDPPIPMLRPSLPTRSHSSRTCSWPMRTRPGYARSPATPFGQMRVWLRHVWQVGHQKRLRPSNSAVRTQFRTPGTGRRHGDRRRCAAGADRMTVHRDHASGRTVMILPRRTPTFIKSTKSVHASANSASPIARPVRYGSMLCRNNSSLR